MPTGTPNPAPTPPTVESTPPTPQSNPGGFADIRWKALREGTKDIGKVALDTFKEYATVDESKGSPSILGIMKGTAKAVWDTISWNSPRGLLNFRGTTLNPLSKEKEFSLNPMIGIRKISAGITLSIAKVLGGTMGLGSDRIGNAVEGGIKAVSRIGGGVIAGDYGQYMQ